MSFSFPFFRRREPLDRDVEGFMPRQPTEIFQSFREVVIADSLVRIVHGSDFGNAAGEFAVHRGTIDLPERDVVPQATILLNGWDLQYRLDDHHVGRLVTEITSSRIEGNQLVWDARGMMLDGKNSPFEWHYYYTIIMWDSFSLDATTDHVNQTTTQSAIQAMSGKSPFVTSVSYYQNNAYDFSETIAVLPRGFNASASAHCHFVVICRSDRHLYQFGYDLGQSETFIQEGKLYDNLQQPPVQSSRIDSGYVSWDSQSIFRDDDHQDHGMFWQTTTVAGRAIGLIQPPFTLIPAIRTEIGSENRREISRDHVIENVPFDYAVPMLTGWNLAYDFGDEHVRRIGVWLTNLSYTRTAEQSGGTLRFRVNAALHDKEGGPNFRFMYRISILGLNTRHDDFEAPSDPEVENPIDDI